MSLLFWKHAVMGLTCSPLLGIVVRVGKLVGFPCYGNASVCKVLKCSGWKMTPPPPKTYATLALLAGSNLKGLMLLVLISLFTVANLRYQLN